MKLISLNVGLPREVSWEGRTVSTGFLKSPVEGPVALRRHNLEGDGQADLRVHGGPTKAVYVYPGQHYDYWRDELGDSGLAWGAFGENFTVEGMDEETVCIGDQFRIGAAQVVVTEPRLPCFKLAICFRRADMPGRFQESGRSGFYLGVVEEGTVEVGDQFEPVAEHPDRLAVAEVVRLYTTARADEALLRKAVSVAALPEKWRGRFAAQLERLRD